MIRHGVDKQSAKIYKITFEMQMVTEDPPKEMENFPGNEKKMESWPPAPNIPDVEGQTF